jgi:UDP-N-acetylglucosamine--N-acetylmuramyl-(pentapeptide) pyrophosphoryl-undecaprenol N-acetylglucosamine transferase
MEQFFPASKIIITGNPVRRNIAESVITRSEGLAFFKLEETKPTVLVTGGSLGAKGINDAIAAQLDELLQNNVQLIWQTGKPFAATAKKLCEGKTDVWTNDFIMQMAYAYAAADVVVSRAGAMAIAELCVVKKPAVLVPFPFAAEDHQTVNAQNLVNKQAAILIKDAAATKELVPALLQLLSSQQQQQTLKNNIEALAVTNADEIIARAILKELEQ